MSLLKATVPTISSCNKDSSSICPIAKQKRLLFPISTHTALCAFDLIYTDIWGLYSVPSLSGSKYFLTIVDDYSRCSWVYLMKHKSKKPSLILSLLIWLQLSSMLPSRS